MSEWSIQLCVLASGSKGNCSVLRITRGLDVRCVLIDLGLSPKRTFEILKGLDLSPESVTDVVLTHMDSDHVQAGWVRALPDHTALHLSKRHLGRAERIGLLYRKSRPFEDSFDLVAGGTVRPLMMSHDEHGVAVFRFELPNGAQFGFATDLGRVTRAMIDHFKDVDVLAIESNYCPQMQRQSTRPAYLKQRIMNGAGHLSNQQCVDAIHEIQPRHHVVLLHLSEECNNPALVAEHHAGCDYALTIAAQNEPTRWISIKTRQPEMRVSEFGSLFAAS